MTIRFTILGEPASSRVTYIYALLDPDTLQPRYVGTCFESVMALAGGASQKKSPAGNLEFLGSYQALIKVNKRIIHLGRHDTAEDAARAYNAAAREHGWPETGLNRL